MLAWSSESSNHADQITIMVLSSFTAEPLRVVLLAWCEQLEIDASVRFGPTGQVLQQLLNPASELCQGSTLNVIIIRVEDLLDVRLHERPSFAQAQEAIERCKRDLLQSAEAYFEGSTPTLFLIGPASADIADPRLRAALGQCENVLAAGLSKNSRARVVASRELFASYPVAHFYDAVSDKEALIPYTPEMYTALATEIARYLHAVTCAERYKVLVVDCDNTLWSGLVAEDGYASVVVDAGRRALQKALIEQAAVGRLICLCSRNNEEDVWSVFDGNPSMLMRREHVVAWRVNWKPKHENLRELAAELSLPIDSFVYFDDDAAVCAEIESVLPEVLTYQIPDRTDELESFVRHVWAFDKPWATLDDRVRTRRYQQERLRRQLARDSSYEEFIRKLGVVIRLKTMDRGDAARVSQLLGRTNQFNSNRMLLSESDLVKNQGRERSCMVVKVRDRFGDHGLVGCLLYREEGPRYVIETMALSCRILGRGVESRLFARIKKLAARAGRTEVEICYRPTQKNKPVELFLDKLGGRCTMNQSGLTIYTVSTSTKRRTPHTEEVEQ